LSKAGKTAEELIVGSSQALDILEAFEVIVYILVFKKEILLTQIQIKNKFQQIFSFSQ
jgi:hypothetical protein